MRGYKNLIYNLASQRRQGGTAAGDKLKAHFSMHFLWKCILNTDPLVRRKIIAQVTLHENTRFVFGRIPGACQSSLQTPFVRICLHNTKSPTTKEASFCQLQGVCSPRPLSSSSCCSQGQPAVQPGSSAGRAGSSPSTAPSGHCKPGTPRLCQASLGVGFFRPSPLSSGLLLNLLKFRRMKKSSVKCLFETKNSNQNKSNRSSKTNLPYLLSSRKKLGKKTPLK